MKNNLILDDFNTSLEEILRDGAKKMLQQAIENEILEYVEKYRDNKDERQRRIVKRNYKVFKE